MLDDDYDFFTVCPYCLAAFNGAARVTELGSAPEDGDVSICVVCHQVSVFQGDASGGLRKPTDDERRVFDADAEIRTVIRAMQAVDAERFQRGVPKPR
jgi:hypothetical protein